MSFIRHDRPELKLRDNLRRELQAAFPLGREYPVDQNWPHFLRPVAEKPKAMAALFSLLASIEEWLGSEGEAFTVQEAPDSVSRAFNSFASTRIQNRYDRTYDGRLWLLDVATEPQDFRPAIVMLLRHARLLD